MRATTPQEYQERFEILEKIAEGGSGSLSLARDTQTSDLVVLKVLHGEVSHDPGRVTAYLEINRTLGSMGHPNLVEVRGTGALPDGRAFLAMEPLAGRDLADVLVEDGPLPVARSIYIGRQICQALAAARARGFVHLDLKPANIFVTGDPGAELVKVLDFGASELHQETAGEHPALGTPEYWSPEQAAGRPVDARSDLYSLGVILYELTCGRTPFGSHSVSDLVAQHLRCTPGRLTTTSTGQPVPPAFEEIVQRCLAKTPEARYDSAQALEQALAQVRLEAEAVGVVRRCPACGEHFADHVQFCPHDGTRLSDLDRVIGADDDEHPLGKVIGSYRLLQLIGEGGMGQVYLAENVRLGRKVALKMLRREHASHPGAVKRFFQEAGAVNQINCENIIEIIDFVEQPGGDNYYIMELLEGCNLADQIKATGPLAVDRVLRIARQICHALAATHRTGIIHRDLKPDNVFLTRRAGQDDFIKLMDFGVAKLSSPVGGESLYRTREGVLVGTPEYMSPEQAACLQVDHRSDIYSFGVILFEMVTGRKPFNAKSVGDLVVQHLTRKPPMPSSLSGLPGQVPGALEELILACLEKEADRRPADMEEVAERLRRVAARAEAPRAAAHRRAPLVILSLAGAAILAIVALALLRVAPVDERPQRSFSPAPAASAHPAGEAVSAVEIALESAPPGADVFEQGGDKLLGRTPIKLSFEGRGDQVRLRLTKAGYQPLEKTVSLDRDQRLAVELRALPAAPARRERSGAVGPPSRRKRAPAGERQAPLDPGATIDPFESD